MPFLNGWNNLLLSLSDNYIYMLIIIIVVSKVYFLFLKNQIDSIFDPFFLTTVYSIMASSLCVYMYFNDLFFKEEMFLAFILTELAYLIGLKVFWTKNWFLNKKIHCSDSALFENILYYIYGAIFIIIQTISVIKLGLPVFSEASRLEFYRDGNGVFVAVNASILFPVLMLTFKKYFTEHMNFFNKIFTFCLFFLIFIFLIGSGSKGAFLGIVYTLFFIKKFYEETNPYLIKIITKFMKFAILVSFIGMFFTLIVELSTNNVEMLIAAFIIRLIGSGDIFAYYYSDNFHNALVLEYSVFYAIFADIFALMRIISYDDVLPPIGLQIWQLINSSSEIRGPNPRHNVFGFLYLGIFGGIFYSFLLGVISSTCRSLWFGLKKKTDFLFYIFLSCIYTTVIKLPTDISLGVNGFFKFILINFIVLVLAYITYIAIKVKK